MAAEIIESSDVTLVEGEAGLANPYPRASWGGIFAGLVLVLAWQILLNLLGLGLGLAALKTIAAGGKPSEGLTLATVVGWVIVSWFTLAAGGFVASRLSGSFRDQDGALHGLAVWATALLISVGIFMAAAATGVTALGGAVSTIAQTGGAVAGAAAGSAAGATNAGGGAGSMAAAGLLRPGNPADLSNEAAAQEIAAGTARLAAGDSGVDRDRLVAVISAKAGISKEEATKRLADWEQAAKDAKAKAAAAAQTALEAGRKASLWGFLALLLGAVAAAIGGCLGTTHARMVYLRNAEGRLDAA